DRDGVPQAVMAVLEVAEDLDEDQELHRRCGVEDALGAVVLLLSGSQVSEVEPPPPAALPEERFDVFRNRPRTRGPAAGEETEEDQRTSSAERAGRQPPLRMIDL